MAACTGKISPFNSRDPVLARQQFPSTRPALFVTHTQITSRVCFCNTCRTVFVTLLDSGSKILCICGYCTASEQGIIFLPKIMGISLLSEKAHIVNMNIYFYVHLYIDHYQGQYFENCYTFSYNMCLLLLHEE
ncbi:hypothetical protein JOM56_009955 [Amanita muscaria]